MLFFESSWQLCIIYHVRTGGCWHRSQYYPNRRSGHQVIRPVILLLPPDPKCQQAIQHLSSDVALTCAILPELGDSLKQDETSKVCSPEAHLTARQMLKQCEQVLLQIQNMIDDSHASSKSRWQQATSKLRSVLNEPDVNLVKGNLERLKSTMLLLLNVIMFAGQIRQ